jgi:tRNA-dihydrouridine synthase
MDWTDVHFRQLARIISKHVWLWTEMVVDKTIIYTEKPDMHLWFPDEQRPLVLQMGGSNPETIRTAAAKAASYGFDEINLNCGCPSDRVAGAGCFGATLMLQPALVAECMTVWNNSHHSRRCCMTLSKVCMAMHGFKVGREGCRGCKVIPWMLQCRLLTMGR